jgi:hypothetical protein
VAIGLVAEDAGLAAGACAAPAGKGFFTGKAAGLAAPKPAVPRYGIDVVGVVEVDRAPAGAEPDRAPFVVASCAGASFLGILFWPTSPGLEALRLRADASADPGAGCAGRCGGRGAPVAGFGEPVPRRWTGGVAEKMRALLGSIEERMSWRGCPGQQSDSRLQHQATHVHGGRQICS